MRNNLKPPCSVLFVFSDVNNSPQLVAILQKFGKEKVAFELIILGKGQSKLCVDLDLLGISYSLSTLSTKYVIPFRFLSILKRIVFLRPQALYASGQFATLIGMPAAFMARVPTRVFTRHHSNFHYYYNMKLGILADKIANRFATTIIAVSKIVEEILLSRENVPESKVKIIYNGIELDQFRKKPSGFETKMRLNSNSNGSMEIGVISRLTQLKGVTYVAEAFVKCLKAFPNAHLSLVGAKADSYPDVSRILSNSPTSSYDFVEFNSDIPKFLKSLNVLVHVPIAVDIESFGLVYVESLAAGVPSIFTVSGVLNEIPNIQEYAQIVPYMDSESIYQAMMNVLTGSMKPKDLFPQQSLSQFEIGVMADLYFSQISSGLSLSHS